MSAAGERGAAGIRSPLPGLPGPEPERPLCTRTPGNKEAGETAARPFRRTPVGPSRKLNASFKSPLKTPQDPEFNSTNLQHDLENLRKKCKDLDDQIEGLISEGYTLEELDQHIDQLHEYNDIKDVGQLLLGKLAVIRGVTTRELYSEFGLDLED
ncbi:DNA repair protein SWI5 homolog [Mustelus asterias]